MRCYCESPIECHCDGVGGTLSEQEARLEILKQHQRVNGRDAATDALIERLTRSRGRDLYVARLEHMMDGEPEEPRAAAGELLGLRVGQIDFAARLIRLDAGETKNGEGCDAPMTSEVYAN